MARLDPRHGVENMPRRPRHERVRLKGPNSRSDTVPHMAQTRRKAI